MPKGKEPKNSLFKSKDFKEQKVVSVIRIERKKIHGQMVNVKICEPGNATNPISLDGFRKISRSDHWEKNRLSLGPLSSGLHGMNHPERSPLPGDSEKIDEENK